MRLRPRPLTCPCMDVKAAEIPANDTPVAAAEEASMSDGFTQHPEEDGGGASRKIREEFPLNSNFRAEESPALVHRARSAIQTVSHFNSAAADF